MVIVVLTVYDFNIPGFLRISHSKDYMSHIERLSMKVVVIFRSERVYDPPKLSQ